MLTVLEDWRVNLNQILLCISGAIQVLQEEITKFSEPCNDNEALSDEQGESTVVRAVSS